LSIENWSLVNEMTNDQYSTRNSQPKVIAARRRIGFNPSLMANTRDLDHAEDGKPDLPEAANWAPAPGSCP
jgi:hypothetical protein